MRICTAPTPFDGIDQEEKQAWLNQRPTQCLLDSLKQRIEGIDNQLTAHLYPDGCTDEVLGKTVRVLRQHRDACVAILEWIANVEVVRG